MDHKNEVRYHKVGMLSQNRILIVLFCFLALAAFAVWAPDSDAYQRYNDGCQNCHGSFTGSTSPKGTTFPSGNKHEMHRATSVMATDCGLCHTSGDNRNPFLGSSDGSGTVAGLGCTGCHNGPGLRAHHRGTVPMASSCGSTSCHSSDPAPPAENVVPDYYGTGATNANDPCNPLAQANVNENWSIGDFQGLDNDGDGLYDMNDPDCQSAPPTNTPPVADAGPDQTVEAGSGGTASVTLNGGGSTDPDAGDSIASYSWSWSFGTATGVSPTVTLAVGTHTITLTVQDTHGATDTDTVVVTVNSPPPLPNQPPVANAGPDQTVEAGSGGTASVTLNGGGSTDPDAGDSIASYSWSWSSGTATGVSPTVTLAVGTHTITLTVQDTHGATDTDTVLVTVNPFTPENSPPVADAGPDQTVTADASGTALVTLDGSGSSDPDSGDSIASYSWSWSSGTATGVSPTVTLAEGAHTITLTVEDTNGATDTDTVLVTVNPETPPPLTVFTMFPEDGSNNVSLTTVVTVTGDGSADISDVVNPATFSLTEGPTAAGTTGLSESDDDDHHSCVSEGVVQGVITYNISDTVATFTPNCDLKESTAYTAAITPVEGVQQSVLTEPMVWSFTTIAMEPDTDDDGDPDVGDDSPNNCRNATPGVPKGKGKITINLDGHPNGCLKKIKATSETVPSVNPAGMPSGFEFRDGIITYEIHGIPPGETGTVTLTYPEGFPAGSKVYKVDSSGFHEYDDAVIDGNTVTVRVTDGGKGDMDGSADGKIVDPVGVAVPSASGSGTIDMSTDAAGGGCSVVGTGGGWKEAVGSCGLLALVWLGLALRRRKPTTAK